ncbi:uncharacterized protein LOC133036285 [Cannabis sativa]|uniref:uncharacterized protein LOC133036285 n=1 Tax=Cannabis sativa TaxID=3483 RepID=UPI0029CA5A16|nr:uncharacterized protein LOC133036285 [Cannabis sativa]
MVPWFADYVNFLAANVTPPEMSRQQLKKFFLEVKHYHWEEPILYKHCANQIIRRCVPEEEMYSVLNHYHALQCGGHFSGIRTAAKVLQSGLYWPTLFKDANDFVKACDRCQRTWNISKRNEMPLTAAATQANDGKTVLSFLQKFIFTWFGTPRAVINDEGSHFYNKQFEALLARYGVRHRTALPYHP